jgi:GST-like protein
MIEVFSTPTANGHKVHIALEETGIAYRAQLLDLQAGAHRTPEFLAHNPLGKLPAIHDPDGPDGAPISLGETGAIVLYICRKAGAFLPGSPREQAEFDFWAFAISASLATPLAMQFYFSTLAPERIDWAIKAMGESAYRSLAAFEARLSAHPYLLGDRYSAVDMLLYPHLAISAQRLPNALKDLPGCSAYVARIGARPAVQRGMAVLSP